MKDIVITIVIFGHTVLEIRPFYWFLIPTKDHFREPLHSRRPLKCETVVVKDEHNGNNTIVRRRQVFQCWQWLCFTATFLIWYRTEAADIYPANYNSEKDEYYAGRWFQLNRTGYFC
jgi:hypothetical protein